MAKLAKRKESPAAGLEPADEATGELFKDTNDSPTAPSDGPPDQKEGWMTVGSRGLNGSGGCTLSKVWNKQFCLGLSKSVADAIKAKAGHCVVKWKPLDDGTMQLGLWPDSTGRKLSDRGGRVKVLFPRKGVELKKSVVLDEPERYGDGFVFTVPGASPPKAEKEEVPSAA
jgi:hypothetical protein